VPDARDGAESVENIAPVIVADLSHCRDLASVLELPFIEWMMEAPLYAELLKISATSILSQK
jgi:hypothetical protein